MKRHFRWIADSSWSDKTNHRDPMHNDRATIAKAEWL
jgi:hypothetical protein